MQDSADLAFERLPSLRLLSIGPNTIKTHMVGDIDLRPAYYLRSIRVDLDGVKSIGASKASLARVQAAEPCSDILDVSTDVVQVGP